MRFLGLWNLGRANADGDYFFDSSRLATVPDMLSVSIGWTAIPALGVRSLGLCASTRTLAEGPAQRDLTSASSFIKKNKRLLGEPVCWVRPSWFKCFPFDAHLWLFLAGFVGSFRVGPPWPTRWCKSRSPFNCSASW